MAEAVVQLPADGSGKKLRTQELTVGGNLVEQEVVTLADADGTLVSHSVVVDTNNSTTATLAGGATFTGTAVDISAYAQVNVELYGAPSTAKASLYLEFSPDGTNWDISIPSLVRNPTFVIPVPLINVGKWFRVRYVNDGGSSAITALGLADVASSPVAQTAFRLTTQLLPTATKELARTLDQTIQGSDAAGLVRSVLMGQRPNGDYVNTPVSGGDFGNSSTANLAAGAAFTGTWRNTTGYHGIMVLVRASHTSANNGFTVEFSEDQSFVHRGAVFTYDDVTNGEQFFIPAMSGEYYRVKYTNGGTTTTTLLIRAELLTTAAQVPLGVMNASITDSSLATMVRSIIGAKNAAGTFGNIERGTSGGLDVGIVQHEVETPIKSLSSIKVTRTTVGTSAVKLITTAQTGRRSMSIKAICSGSALVYIGHSSAVTSSTGYPMTDNDTLDLEVDDSSTDIWAIASTGSQACAMVEAY